MTTQNPCTVSKNFRLYESDISALKQTVDAVNQIKEGRLSNDTEVIRALLRIGAKAKPETILKAIRDTV